MTLEKANCPCCNCDGEGCPATQCPKWITWFRHTWAMIIKNLKGEKNHD